MSHEGTTILIAEDNEDNRIVYTAVLEHFGYRVVSTTNGDEVKSLATKEEPAVILMDISLPGTNGWTATERLKTDPETADIPVIAITAHARSDDRRRAAAAGCDRYLRKPTEPRRVLEEVRRLADDGR